MDGKGPLRADGAFQKVQEAFDKGGKDLNIPALFAADADRFGKFRYE